VFDARRLGNELDRLVGDRVRLARMADAARELGRPDAAGAVAALALSHARRRKATDDAQDRGLKGGRAA
jgi:UDP-N-acetylglucosamine:LPS N-acetylglucosamine transferase